MFQKVINSLFKFCRTSIASEAWVLHGKWKHKLNPCWLAAVDIFGSVRETLMAEGPRLWLLKCRWQRKPKSLRTIWSKVSRSARDLESDCFFILRCHRCNAVMLCWSGSGNYRIHRRKQTPISSDYGSLIETHPECPLNKVVSDVDPDTENSSNLNPPVPSADWTSNFFNKNQPQTIVLQATAR